MTNPPIDPLREGVVMGLEMALGPRPDIAAAPSVELAAQLRVHSPVLNAAEMGEVRLIRRINSRINSRMNDRGSSASPRCIS